MPGQVIAGLHLDVAGRRPWKGFEGEGTVSADWKVAST